MKKLIKIIISRIVTGHASLPVKNILPKNSLRVVNYKKVTRPTKRFRSTQ